MRIEERLINSVYIVTFASCIFACQSFSNSMVSEFGLFSKKIYLYLLLYANVLTFLSVLTAWNLLLQVLISPCGEVATVKSIERDSNSCDIARAGDNVAVSLQGIDGSKLIAGGILCNPGFPVPVSNFLELRVLVLDVTIPILIGYQVKI